MLFCSIAFLVLARLQQHLIKKSAGLANALRFTTNLIHNGIGLRQYWHDPIVYVHCP